MREGQTIKTEALSKEARATRRNGRKERRWRAKCGGTHVVEEDEGARKRFGVGVSPGRIRDGVGKRG
jgi:hypothetical protein